MHPKDILLLSLTIALATCAEPSNRKVHRLVGGHLKTPDQAPNDAELLDALPSGDKKKPDADASGGGEEEKKTLAQQVADGKYGLIQKELFRKPLKQPGIISYDANPEVPKDNINSLGGLSKEDIWLAENHLLVIKGGTYPKHSDKFDNDPLIWPAIDNYTAPKRPVKIPSHPKVPPPFPVQLHDDGPLQILGTNASRTLDGPPPPPSLPPPEGGYVPGTGPFFPPRPDPPYPPAGSAPNRRPAQPPGEGERGPPFPPSLNGSSPPSFAPPSINDFDEDDPSIYYPPPYSFSYPSRDNSSTVPAGPLVPGIILPPPPDFFAPLEETQKTTKRPSYTKRPKPIKTTQHSRDNSSTVPAGPLVPGIILPPPPDFFAPLEEATKTTKRPKPIKTTQQSPQIHPTTTPIPPTSVINITLRKPIKVAQDINNELKPVISTTPPSEPTRKTRPPAAKTKKPSVTILKPVKSHRTYYNQAPSSGDPFAIYGPPKTSTQVPSKHYYTTPNNIITSTPDQPPNYYYYHQEEPQTITPQPEKVVHNFFNLPNQYFEPPRKIQQPKYVYVTSKPFNNKGRQRGRPASFNLHLDKLREQIEYFSSPKPVFREIQQPRAVYQYSFQASNYKPTHQGGFRPSQPDTPSDDDEGFKPMPRYSVQIQQSLDISTHQPTPYPPQNPIYFKETFRSTTERPYYATPKPKWAYNVGQTKGRKNYGGYYVNSEDSYYDDNDNKPGDFGRRIPSHTTPRPQSRYSTRQPKVVYVTSTQRQPRPISLEGDTLVNYVNPRPNINPDAELIPVEPPQRAKYPQNYAQRPQLPYLRQRPQFVEAIPISVSDEDSRRGSFISYSLPGNNGAHFYFLTPQLAQSRDQGADFYYSQRDNGRIRRNNER